MLIVLLVTVRGPARHWISDAASQNSGQVLSLETAITTCMALALRPAVVADYVVTL